MRATSHRDASRKTLLLDPVHVASAKVPRCERCEGKAPRSPLPPDCVHRLDLALNLDLAPHLDHDLPLEIGRRSPLLTRGQLHLRALADKILPAGFPRGHRRTLPVAGRPVYRSIATANAPCRSARALASQRAHRYTLHAHTYRGT
eukprot:1237287-Pleurochrysis_carterae.AAC.1